MRGSASVATMNGQRAASGRRSTPGGRPRDTSASTATSVTASRVEARIARGVLRAMLRRGPQRRRDEREGGDHERHALGARAVAEEHGDGDERVGEHEACARVSPRQA